jgi:hypothetical protein
MKNIIEKILLEITLLYDYLQALDLELLEDEDLKWSFVEVIKVV